MSEITPSAMTGIVGYCESCGWPVAAEGCRIASEYDIPRAQHHPSRCADTACVVIRRERRDTPITPGRCPYCGAPYTLDAGGCTAKCQEWDRHRRAVHEAARAAVTEQDEPTLTPPMVVRPGFRARVEALARRLQDDRLLSASMIEALIWRALAGPEPEGPYVHQRELPPAERWSARGY